MRGCASFHFGRRDGVAEEQKLFYVFRQRVECFIEVSCSSQGKPNSFRAFCELLFSFTI